MLILSFAAFAASSPAHAGGDLPKPQTDLPTTQPAGKQSAVFAAGCFWCVEGVFQQLDGVSEVVSGYAGGTRETANYKAVCTGLTGHAEVVRITYDPAKITFGELLRVFFATHDPTTKDRQGPDAGPQYRSAIFCADEAQKHVAEAYITQLTDAKAFDQPIVTTLEKLNGFYPAEDYHQDFVNNNPTQPYVCRYAIPKIEKVRKMFKDEVKPEAQKP